jgi:peptidyl-tRNA hydrolase, PTH1 family
VDIPRLLVGLGNPGPKYVHTRHNVGRRFIEDYWRSHAPSDFPFETFVLPSFMNNSGPALKSAGADRAEPKNLLILVDDFMIPFGTLRLRPEGSSGGHNGLKSIIETYGTEAFGRLRIGVGPVPENEDPADFVLKNFTAEEEKRLSDVFAAIVDGLQVFVKEGYPRAMNVMNKAHLTV